MGHELPLNDLQPTLTLFSGAEEENEISPNNVNWKLNAPIAPINSPTETQCTNESSDDRGYDLNKSNTSACTLEKKEIQIHFQNQLNEIANSGSKPATISQQNMQFQQPKKQLQIILAQYYDVGNLRIFVIPQHQAAISKELIANNTEETMANHIN